MVDEDEESRKEGYEADVPNNTADGYLIVLREATSEEKEVELRVQQKIEALKRGHEGSHVVRNNINILQFNAIVTVQGLFFNKNKICK